MIKNGYIILAAIAVLQFFSTTNLLADGDKKFPKLRMVTPKSGQTYEKSIELSAVLENVLNQSYKMRISCFGVVHYYIVTPHPREPAKKVLSRYLRDKLLPCVPGRHTMEISIFSLADPETTIISRKVVFNIKKTASK